MEHVKHPLVSVATLAAPLRVVTRRCRIGRLVSVWVSRLHQTRLLSVLRAASAASASGAIALSGIAIACRLCIALVSVTVTTRAYWDTVALYDPIVCKASRIHAVIGRKVPADAIGRESRFLSC